MEVDESDAQDAARLDGYTSEEQAEGNNLLLILEQTIQSVLERNVPEAYRDNRELIVPAVMHQLDENTKKNLKSNADVVKLLFRAGKKHTTCVETILEELRQAQGPRPSRGPSRSAGGTAGPPDSPQHREVPPPYSTLNKLYGDVLELMRSAGLEDWAAKMLQERRVDCRDNLPGLPTSWPTNLVERGSAEERRRLIRQIRSILKQPEPGPPQYFYFMPHVNITSRWKAEHLTEDKRPVDDWLVVTFGVAYNIQERLGAEFGKAVPIALGYEFHFLDAVILKPDTRSGRDIETPLKRLMKLANKRHTRGDKARQIMWEHHTLPYDHPACAYPDHTPVGWKDETILISPKLWKIIETLRRIPNELIGVGALVELGEKESACRLFSLLTGTAICEYL